MAPMVGVLGALAGPLGIGLSVGSSILGGLSAYGQSKQQAAAYEANARIAEQQAANQAAQERDKYRRLAGSQRAALGASGVDVNYGSPIDVLADTDAEGEVSAMQLLYGGKLEAANLRGQAEAARSEGRASLIGGILDGVGTGILGAAKLGYIDGGPARNGTIFKTVKKNSVSKVSW